MDSAIKKAIGPLLILGGTALVALAFGVDYLQIEALSAQRFGPYQVIALALGCVALVLGILFTTAVTDPDRVSAAVLNPPAGLALALAVAIAIAISVGLFSSTGRDDSYISYWPAYTLAHHGVITNYNGAGVEQSSSLLMVLLMAVSTFVTSVPPEVVGPILSLLFSGATVVLVYWLTRRIAPGAAFLAALLTATSTYFTYWAVSGMEMTLTGFLIIAAVVVYVSYITSDRARTGRFVAAAGLTAALLTVRPEAPVVVLCVLAGLLVIRVARHEEWRRAALLLGMALGLTVLLVAFREIVFAQPLPQPVLAKVSGRPLLSSAAKGWHYLQRQLLSSPVLSIRTALMVLACGYAGWRVLREKEMSLPVLLLLLFGAAQIAFTLFVGGDWMEGGRFIAPALPALFILVALASERLLPYLTLRAGFAAMFLALQLLVLKDFLADGSTGMPVWAARQFEQSYARDYGGSQYSWFDLANRVHLRDIPTIYHLGKIVSAINSSTGQPVVIYSHQAGMTAYYITRDHAGETRFYDMGSLANREFIDCPPARAAIRPFSGGSSISLDFVLTNRQVLAETCGIPQPDIIVELGLGTNSDLYSANGYTIVYLQTGEISPSIEFFWGMPRNINQFIAVRDDLLSLVPWSGKIEITISDLMPASQ